MKKTVTVQEKDIKKAKVSIWSGIILCVISLAIFLAGFIMLATSESINKTGGGIAGVPLVAVTICFLAPAFLVGLTLIFYGILKLKSVKHAGLIAFLCTVLVILILSIIIITRMMLLQHGIITA